MKILHVIKSTDFAGAEQLMLTLGMCQHRQGDEVFFCVPANAPLRERISEAGLNLLDIEYGGLSSRFALMRFCRDNKIDIVNAHLTSATGTAAFISYLTKTKPVAHAHVYSTDVSYRIVAKRGALIAVGEDVAEFFEKKAKIPRERIATIVNATLIHEEPDAGRNKSELRAEICNELAISIDSPLLLLPGRICTPKAQDVVVDALPEVLRQFPNLQTIFAGKLDEEPEFADKLRAQIKRLGLEERVHLIGLRKDVARLNRAADIVLVPSRWDPFPLAVIEAMALGCPIIGSRVGGIAEMLADPSVGVLVEAENPNELAAVIIELLADPDKAARLGKRASEEARKLYSPDAMTQRVSEVYKKVLRTR